MKANELKLGNWVFVEDGRHQYIGVIANGGTTGRPDLYFSGTSENGGCKAITLNHLDECKIKQIIL